MFETIYDLIAGTSGDIWIYAALCVIVLVFLIFLILGLLTGEQKKFKSAAKIFLSDPNEKTAFMSAKKMPMKVRKQFKQAKMTGLKYSDCISYDACVSEPYQKSLISKFVISTVLATVFSFFLVFSLMFLFIFSIPIPVGIHIYVGPVLVLVLGFLLIIIAAIIAMLVKKGLNKIYEKYIDELDKLSASNLEMPMEESQEYVAPIKKQKKQKPQREEPQDIQTRGFGFSGPLTHQDTFNSPTSLDIEIDSVGVMEDNKGARFVEAEPVFSIDSQPEVVATPPPPPKVPNNNIVDERAAVDAEVKKAVEEAERARKMAETKPGTITRTETTTTTFETVIATPPPSQSSSQSADDIIQKIEKISKEGAPLASMKEVAMLLQQERAKPENKSPEQQQKLNAALSMLLKAMSTAGKK